MRDSWAGSDRRCSGLVAEYGGREAGDGGAGLCLSQIKVQPVREQLMAVLLRGGVSNLCRLRGGC